MPEIQDGRHLAAFFFGRVRSARGQSPKKRTQEEEGGYKKEGDGSLFGLAFVKPSDIWSEGGGVGDEEEGFTEIGRGVGGGPPLCFNGMVGRGERSKEGKKGGL